MNRIFNARLAKWTTLAFAVSWFNCHLTPEQIRAMTDAGLDYRTDMDLENIFHKVGMESYEWGTQISADHDGMPDYNHQSGYSVLADDVSMAVIQEEAVAGNQVLRNDIADILAQPFDYDQNPINQKFFADLNAISPDPDHFGHYLENKALVCPETTRLFVDEYLHSTQKSASFE
jgi:hypothetical protein